MKYLRWIAAILVLLLVVGLAGFGYASHVASQKLSRIVEIPDVDIPVPWPLTDEEIDALGEEGDVEAVALERGKHLMTARYGCAECHGADLSGGVMIDDAAVGKVLGPNLTGGKGSVVDGYTVSDWNRIVRHGVTKKGNPTVMPSMDFLAMSDQELSDIIVYIQSLPPVDNTVAPVRLGPLGKVLLATGNIILTADMIDHAPNHLRVPPKAEPTAEFGQHLAQVCTGCHGATFAGGPVPGGPPDWPKTMNLTSHAEGLGGWTFEEFDTVMRQAKKRDGSPVLSPMAEVAHFGKNMTDTEMRAMFAFLTSLPPLPTPK